MTSPASVAGRERLRLFCGLRLPDDAVRAIAEWQAVALPGRAVDAQNLHVTLAFLGARPACELAAIGRELAAAAAVAVPPVLEVRSYRETRSVGMLVLDDRGGHAERLAADVQARLERLGVYRQERREWLPHLTVLRFRERPRLAPALPDLGEIAPSEAAVYHSLLRPTGAQYEALVAVALGG